MAYRSTSSNISNISTRSIPLKKNPAPYRPRGQSESAAVVDKNKQLTPKHDKSAAHSTKFSTPLSDTPSTSRVCDICKGMQDLRSLKLKEVVAEFESKIEAYKDLTTSLNNNSSMLNHALDTIKHFIMRTEPNDIDTFFSKTNEKISALSENVHDLSKYVTKLDSVEEFVNKKIDNVLSNSLTISEPNSKVIKRLDNLESICGELKGKIDKFNVAPFNHPPTLNTQTNTSRTSTPASLHPHPNPNPNTSRTSTPASLHPHPNPNPNTSRTSTPASLHPHPNPNPNTSRTSTPASLHPHPNPKTCIILGDSNTKYVSLASNTLDAHRVPTFLIEDIDPYNCIGCKKIWIDVGTNNIKSIHCRNMDDVKKHFNTFMNKLDTIRNLCPHSKLIVSPILPTAILPTAITALNRRALMFNKLLFSKPNWFITLDFNLFCGSDGNLMSIYRCYNNQHDRIHLGSLGIQILTSKAKHCLTLTNTRSYASAVRQY